MTIEKESLSESALQAIALDGSTGAAPSSGAQLRNRTDHEGPRNGFENVLELVDHLTLEVIHLRIAQQSNRRIGMAMGIVMNQLHLDDSQAFDALRRISQNSNRKLRDVAELVGDPETGSRLDRRHALFEIVHVDVQEVPRTDFRLVDSGRISGQIRKHRHHERQFNLALRVIRIVVTDVHTRHAVATNELLAAVCTHKRPPIDRAPRRIGLPAHGKITWA